MSEEPERKSHAMTWTLAAVVVPVLYVLSYGPVEGLRQNGTLPDPHPRWLLSFYTPFFRLYETSLREPLIAYVDWWIKVLNP